MGVRINRTVHLHEQYVLHVHHERSEEGGPGPPPPRPKSLTNKLFHFKL